MNESKYWFAYFSFLEFFKEINYRGIPIAFLSFRVHEFARYFYTIDFDDYNITELKKDQVQPYMERLLRQSIIKQPSNQALNGKILLCDSHESYFNSKFKPSYISTQFSADSYLTGGIRKSIFEIQSKVRQLFTSLRNHIQVRKNPIVAIPQIEIDFINSIHLTIPMIEHILSYYQDPISCVVLGTTNGIFGRAVAIVARAKGVPSICLQHGIIGHFNGWAPVFTTVQTVYGENEKQYFKEFGVLESQVRVMGLPRFDAIFSRKHMARSSFFQKHNMDPNKKIVTIGTLLTDVNFLEDIIKQLSYYPIHIVLKQHPIEFMPQFKIDLRFFGEKYTSVRLLGDLYDIIFNSDLLVVPLSTIGIEALLFNKPVIYYRRSIYGGAQYNYYSELIETDPVKIASMVIGHLIDDDPILRSNDIKQYLQNAYPVTNATRALSDLIKELTD